MAGFPYYKQLDVMDCGPTCIRMIARHYGRHYTLKTLREKSTVDREGISLQGIGEIAEAVGFRSLGVKLDFDTLAKEAPLPAVAHWNQNHFVVVYKIKNDKIYIADPAYGMLVYSKQDFIKSWASDRQNGAESGILLLLEPGPDFLEREEEKQDKSSFRFLFRYLSPFRKYLTQLFFGLILGSLFQLIFPFLTQAVVDFGVGTRNVGFVYLILIAQLVLFASQMAMQFIQAWILIHLSTRINISILSDFLIKLMKLPVGFFDSKKTGDLMQRIGDHRRIELFLTDAVLNSLFSLFTLVILGFVLAIYSLPVFFIFLTGSTLYVGWILLFLKKRAQLDHKSFAQMAAEQSNIIQLITGMQEIKLNNIERSRRWEWERIQAKLFRINLKKLSLTQYQQGGARFFNQIQNILIIFISAQAVIEGDMTMGMMMAITYISGQLNTPIGQLISFLQQAQDAKISLERLGEIHNSQDEDEEGGIANDFFPSDRSISIRNLGFRYGGTGSAEVLSNLSLHIPKGKITAIVGASGSGKTTLIKLLLKFYPPQEGQIQIGNIRLEDIRSHKWRNSCGVVMQDGFIFSDSIANNIAMEETIDKYRLQQAVAIANIRPFIDELPLGFNTKIGQEGLGLSGGQKQRILIARAVYKNPDYLFFDEATSALDATNERQIMENLENFFIGKTVIIVAHRLSTVKNADQIIVLDRGKVVETGHHSTLVDHRGQYYSLIKNQLELGN
ncbi:MAG: peptidase domain-containing ABC transporter [Bacteroidia bacterium]|nr:peptidase domain-containing ABC transporter [Bacteroidia bacterium]